MGPRRHITLDARAWYVYDIGMDTKPMTDADRARIDRAHANGLSVYVMVTGAPVVASNGCTLHYKCTGVKVLRSRGRGDGSALTTWKR